MVTLMAVRDMGSKIPDIVQWQGIKSSDQCAEGAPHSIRTRRLSVTHTQGLESKNNCCGHPMNEVFLWTSLNCPLSSSRDLFIKELPVQGRLQDDY